MSMDMKIFKSDEAPIVSLSGTTEERQALRYNWAEVCFNSDVASQSDQASEDFIRGFSWYASFRWFLGKKNEFLDNLIDVEGRKPEQVSKKEYLLNRRIWVKWVRKYDW